MLGSHNTFTYKSAKWKIFNLFSNFWRCQDKTIDEQYNLGVRYFDIRVRKIKNGYQICHGIIDVKRTFMSLDEICYYIGLNYPNSTFRLVLERGDKSEFLRNVEFIKTFKNLDEVIIKKPWKTIYKRKEALPIIEYSFEDWTWKNLFKCLYKNLIKNKEKISIKDALEDKSTIHLMDYV